MVKVNFLSIDSLILFEGVNQRCIGYRLVQNTDSF